MESFLSLLEIFFDEKMAAGEDATMPCYKEMKYPGWMPLMKFKTKRVNISEFGNIMMMNTTAMGGMMNLLTVSFTPSSGKNVPFLLVDCMEMKNKALAYVEYYDCTGKKLKSKELEEIAGSFKDVPDYEEKEAWYVSERMEGSMIKGGKNVDPMSLFELVTKSVNAYLKMIQNADNDEENIERLRKFQSRMVLDGNPSQSTMQKVLGKDGADKFFTEYVMKI